MTDFSEKIILVAEDDPHFMAFVKAVVEDMGMGKVETAIDGAEAFRKIIGAEDDFDLIICDYLMPSLNGMDLFRLIRKARMATEFIMLTARDREEDQEVILGGGCENYIAKPVDAELLADTVRAILEDN